MAWLEKRHLFWLAPKHTVDSLWSLILGCLTPEKHNHLHFLFQTFYPFLTYALQLHKQLPMLTATSKASSALISVWEEISASILAFSFALRCTSEALLIQTIIILKTAPAISIFCLEYIRTLFKGKKYLF